MPVGSTPDADWQALQVLLVPLPQLPLSQFASAPDQRQSTVERDAGRLHQAALQARDFYSKYPKEGRVAAAKKFEAVAALQSVQRGGEGFRASALAIGSAFRADKSLDVGDRFDVAVAMETAGLNATLGGKRLVDSGTTFEGMADRLAVEFGDVPQVFALYVGILNTADAVTAQRVAAKIQRPGAPDWAKAEAQRTLDRAGLIGRPAPNIFKKANGQIRGFGNGANGPTVIAFYNTASAAEDLAALKTTAAPIATGVDWVYVALDSGGSTNPGLSGARPFAGDDYRDGASLGGQIAQAFKVSRTPYVYVLNSKGQVSGYGRLEDLPMLVRAASR